MLTLDHATELIRQLDALRQRIDALDVAATGICAGMRLNTLGGEAAYQLLDVIAADLKARADAAMRLLVEPASTVVRPFAGAEPTQGGVALVATCAHGRGSRPTPASSAGAL